MGSARQKATEMRQIELSKKKIPSFLHTSAHRKRRRPCSLPHAWVQQQLHDMVSSLSRAGGSGVASPTVVWVGGSKRGGEEEGGALRNSWGTGKVRLHCGTYVATFFY